MKKALSKNLIFGVIATSIILVNCQKAPSRGVKGKGAPGSAMSGKIENNEAADLKNMKVCDVKVAQSLQATYQTQYKILDLFKLSAEEFNQAKKDELNSLAQTLASQCQDTNKAIVDTKMTECKVISSSRAETAMSVAINSKACADWGDSIQKKSGSSNDLNKLADNASTNSVANENVFDAGTTFLVSKDLGELLDKNDKSEATFVKGQSFNGSDSFLGFVQKGETACKISQKSLKLSEGAKLKVVDVKSSKTETGSVQVILTLTSVNKSEGSNVYGFNCDVNKAEASQAQKAILAAFGESLKITKSTQEYATGAIVPETDDAATEASVTDQNEQALAKSAKNGLVSTHTNEVKNSQIQTGTKASSSMQEIFRKQELAAQYEADRNAKEQQSQQQDTLDQLAKKADEAVLGNVKTSESTTVNNNAEKVEASKASSASVTTTVQQNAEADLKKAEEAMKNQQELDRIAAQKVQAAKLAAEQSALATIHAVKSAMYADEAKRQQAIATEQAKIANEKAKEAANYAAEANRIKESEAKSKFRQSELKKQN